MRRAIAAVALVACSGLVAFVLVREHPRSTTPNDQTRTDTALAHADRATVVHDVGSASLGPVIMRPQPVANDQATVSGVVVERGSGRRVAGAKVRLISDGEWSAGRAAITQTDASGTFFFVAAIGDYHVRASKGRLAGAWSGVVHAAPDAIPDDIRIELAPAGRIAGVIRALDGRAVAGAAIQVNRDGESAPELEPVRYDKTTFIPKFAPRADVRSLEDGRYAVEGLLPGKYTIKVFADSYSPTERSVEVSDRDVDEFDFTLPSLATISGVVLCKDGRPCANIGVEVHAGAGMWSPVDFATSDERGRFKLDKVHVGEMFVEASSASEGSAQEKLTLHSGEARTLTLKLDEGATVSGRVTREDGAPARDVHVSCELVSTRTDSNGRYRIVGVHPGPIAVQTEGASTLKDIEPHQHLVVDLIIATRTHHLRGVVVGPDGAPVWGATVDVSTGEFGLGPRATTNPDGLFDVERLPAGKFDVTAERAGFVNALLHAVAVDTTIRVQLRAPASLAGIVTDASGAPVPSYSLVVANVPERDAHSWPTDKQRRVDKAGGGFVVDGLAGGTYRIIVRTTDGRVGQLDSVVVGDGAQRTGLRITLGGASALDGRVVDAVSGAALGGAGLSAFVNYNDFGDSETDAQGSFRLGGLPAGSIELVVGAEHHVVQRRIVSIEPSGTTHAGTIALQPKTPAP
jgi:hypothetical protein